MGYGLSGVSISASIERRSASARPIAAVSSVSSYCGDATDPAALGRVIWPGHHQGRYALPHGGYTALMGGWA